MLLGPHGGRCTPQGTAAAVAWGEGLSAVPVPRGCLFIGWRESMEPRRGFLIERDGSRSGGAVAPERGSLGAFAWEQTGDNRSSVVDGGSLITPRPVMRSMTTEGVPYLPL